MSNATAVKTAKNNNKKEATEAKGNAGTVETPTAKAMQSICTALAFLATNAIKYKTGYMRPEHPVAGKVFDRLPKLIQDAAQCSKEDAFDLMGITEAEFKAFTARAELIPAYKTAAPKE